MSSYREQFFEWVNKQPVYQDMTLQTKEMILTLVNCWLNNNQAYFHYARLNGKEFAKKCAVDFCWFIKNQTIAGLQHRLEVAEKALELACEELMSDLEFDSELDKHYNLQANIEYFKTKAKEMLENE